jgi:hypothetical protein
MPTEVKCKIDLYTNLIQIVVVLQHPVARHLSFLCYSPSHIQTRLKILKFKFLKFVNYVHITVALRAWTDMVIIRCFEIAVEIAALPSLSSIRSIPSSMHPCVVVRFMVMGDSSCCIVCSCYRRGCTSNLNLFTEVQQLQQQFRSTWWWLCRSKHVVQQLCTNKFKLKKNLILKC